MDNRSIAAVFETNKTRMNFVMICSPSKGAGQEKKESCKKATGDAGVRQEEKTKETIIILYSLF